MANYILLAFAVLAGLVLAAKWRQVKASWLSTRKFLLEVKVEMYKVSWPSRNEVIGSAIVVLTAVLVLTLVITAADEVLSKIMNLLLRTKGA